MERPPRNVLLDRQSAWGLVTLLKVPFADPAARSLRMRINSALLRIVDESVPVVAMPLETEREAWLIDAALHPQQGQWAADLILQIARVLWEFEYDLPMSESARDHPFTAETRQSLDTMGELDGGDAAGVA